MEKFAENLKKITNGFREKINKLFESTNLKNTISLLGDIAIGTTSDDEENDDDENEEENNENKKEE